MKKIIAIITFGFILFGVNAQGQKTGDAATINQTDSLIMANTILPAVLEAADKKEDPDWNNLSASIGKEYGADYAERTVMKGQIYFYYQVENHPAFATSIVRFTTKYEDKENFKLMNKNANYVLPNSKDKTELETARNWVQHAVDKEPSNADYKKTLDALNAKIGSLH